MAGESCRYLSAILILIAYARFLKRGSGFITAADSGAGRRNVSNGPKWTSEKAKSKTNKRYRFWWQVQLLRAARPPSHPPTSFHKEGLEQQHNGWLPGFYSMERCPVSILHATTATTTFSFLMEGSFPFQLPSSWLIVTVANYAGQCSSSSECIKTLADVPVGLTE